MSEFTFYITKIDALVRWCFRGRDPEFIEEMQSRGRGLAWMAWTALEKEGRLDEAIWNVSLGYMLRQLRVGRTPEGRGGSQTRDLTSLRAERITGGDAVEGLTSTRDDPADVAEARDLLEVYEGRIGERDKRLLERILQGATVGELREEFNVSPGRVSQKRREFRTGIEELASE